MIMINEKQFAQKDLEKYLTRGYICAVSDGKNFPKVHKGEPVSFILCEDLLYSINIKQIDWLVHTNHKVNIKLGDKIWKNVTAEEWKSSFKVNGRFQTTKHYVLQLFETKRNEYFEQLERAKARTRYEDVVHQLYPDGKIPSDIELQTYIDTWSRAYDIQVDFNNKQDVLIKYKALKFYVDNNLDVSNRDSEPDVVYVGDENLFEDLVYKGHIEGI